MKMTHNTCKMLRAWGLVFLSFTFLLFQNDVLAQNEIDVLRYSWTESLGTIRTTGMGGAFGALGADIGSMGINPAGIGMYRRGDASISTGLHSSETTTSIGNISKTASKISGTVGVLGVVLTIPSVNPDWPFLSMGITHAKRGIFNQRLDIQGARFNGSLLGVFDGLANGTDNSLLSNGSEYAYTSSLAWNTYLLDPDGNSSTTYITPFATDTTVLVDRNIERSGSMGETQYSLGGTYKGWLSLGASIATTKVSFSETSKHDEVPLEAGTDLASWSYYETLNISGTGLTGRLGAIIAVSKWMRVGVAWHSPTRLQLSDSYSTSIESVWKDGERYESNSPQGGYEYIIITPSKTILSSSFVMGKYAIISADYETLDYSSGKLKELNPEPGTDIFKQENTAVATTYQRGHQARIGLEIRVAKNWRVRAGTGIATSPFSSESGVLSNPTQYRASLGGEYRSKNWYAGFSWNSTWHQEDLYFIDPVLQGGPANIQRKTGMLSIGAGFRI